MSDDNLVHGSMRYPQFCTNHITLEIEGMFKPTSPCSLFNNIYLFDIIYYKEIYGSDGVRNFSAMSHGKCSIYDLEREKTLKDKLECQQGRDLCQ